VTEGRPGRLIALEGTDGCGKSTQARLLSDRLGALLTFEPGATRLGESLRRLLLDSDQPAVSERAEALLMAADRAQHVAEVVMPALEAGTWVVTDRFSASTLAYQGFGRGLDRPELERLIQWASAGVTPDLNVLIDVPVEVAAARRRGSRHDRLEIEGDPFQRRVADGYHLLAKEAAPPWLVVDGTGSVDEVAAAVWSGVTDAVGPGIDGGRG
jgi:dTMP kinase